MGDSTASTAPLPSGKKQLFIGSFIHSKTLDQLEYLHDTVIFVDDEVSSTASTTTTTTKTTSSVPSAGKIIAIHTLTPSTCTLSHIHTTLFPLYSWSPSDTTITTTRTSPNQFFFPGFIDTHLHASQYPNVGIFGKSTLLDWLNKYTFPLEASLADPARARRVYARCIRKTLSHGTTTAAYYATVDVASTNLLTDLCLQAGQRALVGRVCMDQLSPDWYRDESPAASVAATKETIAYIESKDPGMELVRPVITPRFAPSCSAELMGKLGELARETGLPVQTHISENLNEVALVRELFPASPRPEPSKDHDDSEDNNVDNDGGYPGVYDRFGLLTSKTILAHAIHLSDAEANLISLRAAKVSHCPCSNSAITSGAARVRWLLQKNIDVGLGTDMSGGYSPSVLDAARQANMVSRHVAMGGDEGAKLSVEEVLYLATRGGARVVGLEGKVGGFERGMEWDVQLVELGSVGADGRGGVGGGDGDGEGEEEKREESNVDVFGWESWEDRIAKWLFNGDDRNTRKVWVRGRLVHERTLDFGVCSKT